MARNRVWIVTKEEEGNSSVALGNQMRWALTDERLVTGVQVKMATDADWLSIRQEAVESAANSVLVFLAADMLEVARGIKAEHPGIRVVFVTYEPPEGLPVDDVDVVWIDADQEKFPYEKIPELILGE